MDVAPEHVEDPGLEPRLGVFAVRQYDEIAVAVVALAEALESGSQHPVVVGASHRHVVRIEGRQEFPDDLIIRAHGNLHKRGSREDDQGDVLAPERVQEPLDGRLRRAQPRSLIRHVRGPHAARQIQSNHDLHALAEGELWLLAPLWAGECDDPQGDGRHDQVRRIRLARPDRTHAAVRIDRYPTHRRPQRLRVESFPADQPRRGRRQQQCEQHPGICPTHWRCLKPTPPSGRCGNSRPTRRAPTKSRPARRTR